MKWSDDQFETLKGLVDQGLTSTQIGKELGVTRNAVIGKAHRGGVALTHKQGESNEPRRATRRYHKTQKKKEKKEKTVAHERPPGLVDLDPETTAAAVSFAELAQAHCRWPVSGEGAAMAYCGGDRINGFSYCLRHCRMAYQPGRRA